MGVKGSTKWRKYLETWSWCLLITKKAQKHVFPPLVLTFTPHYIITDKGLSAHQVWPLKSDYSAPNKMAV